MFGNNSVKRQSQVNEEEILNDYIQNFIKKQKEKSDSNGAAFFFQEGPYEILFKEKWYKVNLTNSLLLRSSESRPNEFRIEQFESNGNLGKGSYGVLKKIKTTWSPTVSGKWMAKDHGRVDKLQTIGKDESQILDVKAGDDERIKREIEFNNHAGISSKLVSVGNYRHTVMPQIKGIELRKMLERTRLSPNDKEYIKLTIDQRIDIILDLLHDMQYLHAIGIIHRDIKPENVIVDLDGRGSRIIDFGLSKINDPNHSKDAWRVGNLRYMAPEQYEYSITNEKSDNYALTKTIAQILGLDPLTNLISPEKKYNDQLFELHELLKNDTRYCNRKFFQIFDDLLIGSSGSLEHLELKEFEVKEYINELRKFTGDAIVSSTRSNPNNRLSLNEMIEKFEEIKMAVKLIRKDFVFEKGVRKEDLITANSQGILARNEYLKSVKNKKSLSKEEWMSLIESGLANLQDKPSVIKEFVDALGVKSFLELDTKKSITDQIELIHNLYDSSKEFFIENFFEQLESEVFNRKNISEADSLKIKKALEAEKKHWQQKHEKYRNSIDQKDIFNQKLFSKETECRLLQKFDVTVSKSKDDYQTGLTLFQNKNDREDQQPQPLYQDQIKQQASSSLPNSLLFAMGLNGSSGL